MEQTIAAISTSTMSSGGISIVRISGENAISVADTIFEAKNNKKLSKADSHTIHYGVIKDGDEVIDEVLEMCIRDRGYTETCKSMIHLLKLHNMYR